MPPDGRAPPAPPRSLAERAYHALLWCYPAGFRRDYGALMAQLFRDLQRDARQRGRLAPAGVWVQVLIETAGTAPLEHLAQWRQTMRNTSDMPPSSTPSPATAMTLGAAVLTLALLAGGVVAKIILTERYDAVAAGAVVLLVTSLAAAVIVEVAARARGVVLGAAALLLAGGLLPLLWVADRTAWLRENPLNLGLVVVLVAAGLTRERRWLLLVAAAALAALQIAVSFI